MNGKRLNRPNYPETNGRRPSTRNGYPTRNGQKPRKKNRALRVVVTVFAVLLVIVAAAIAWWKIGFIDKPDIPSVKKADTAENGPIRTVDDTRKKDFFTFLVIGRDTVGGGNTDTILLASYDIPNQKLDVMSIPRDTMVNVPWDIKKINSVYNYYGGGEEGIEALDSEISQLVGFVPDYQIVLEWKAVGELVDALGGVQFDVPVDMKHTADDIVINLKKGPQKLDGNAAMQLVRFRGYPNADIGRIETQQKFLAAVIKQCLNISNVTRINELAKVFNDNVTMNLKIKHLAWFADKAIFGGLKMENVRFHTMPHDLVDAWSRERGGGLSYVVPKTEELVDMVNQYFNPYEDDLKANELDIMFLNKDGSIGSSTGKVEDKGAKIAKKSTSDSSKSSSSNKKSSSGNSKSGSGSSSSGSSSSGGSSNSGSSSSGSSSSGGSSNSGSGSSDSGGSGSGGTGETGETGGTGSSGSGSESGTGGGVEPAPTPAPAEPTQSGGSTQAGES